MTYVRRLVSAGLGTRDEILYDMPYVHGLLYLHDLLIEQGVTLAWVSGADEAVSFRAAYERVCEAWGYAPKGGAA